ncbi:hypothetical protein LLH23_07935 [bacterium]|nr:hypothetical protein [bacterium]
MTQSALLLILCLLVVCASAQAQPPPGFKLHGSFTGIGGGLNTVVGPGPDGKTEWVYSSHVYSDRFDIVAVEPATGRTEVFTCPLAGECGAWALVLGPDRQIYAGSLPRARVWRLDWPSHSLMDMGQPSPAEQYIWQLAVGADKKLYGCTYPQAKLVRVDPATGKGEDLGRMNETEMYAREIAADDKGFVYIGIGSSQRDVVAYEIATGTHRSILPPDLAKPGWAGVYRGANGGIYAAVGKWLRLDGFNPPVEVPEAEVSRPAPPTLADGTIVYYHGATIGLRDPATGQIAERATSYKGKPQAIFRLGLGPDGRLYGSTAMPIHFFWADPDSDKWEEIAEAGGGEFYSFLAWKDRLIGCAYSAPSPIMIYDPKQPWKPAAKREGNPWQIHYEGENAGWRPMALVNGPNDRVYIGAVSGYGALGGPLCVLDPATGKVGQTMHLVQDQSVICLAVLPDGLIVGGTTVGGGGGSHATQTEAKVFLYDPQKREKLFETVAVPGKSAIEALGVGKNGLVYGFAGGDTMFIFDPKQRKVTATAPNQLGGVTYNSVFPGPDGVLYGLYHAGIFRVDEATNQIKQVAEYPAGISAGVALRGRDIFFASGPRIVSYTLPQ